MGNQKDVATGIEEDQLAKNTVVLKVDGNLTINQDITIKSVTSTEGFGGPKGLIIYCKEVLNNFGIINMTGNGGLAKPQNIYICALRGGTFEFVPSTGATGSSGAIQLGVSGSKKAVSAQSAVSSSRATGGGGGGNAYVYAPNGQSATSTGGNGANGTSYHRRISVGGGAARGYDGPKQVNGENAAINNPR